MPSEIPTTRRKPRTFVLKGEAAARFIEQLAGALQSPVRDDGTSKSEFRTARKEVPHAD